MANGSNRREVETTTEARGASTPHMTRYILAASMALIILAFVILLVVGG